MKKNILIGICIISMSIIIGRAECKKKKTTASASTSTSVSKKADPISELQQLVYSLTQQITVFETDASNAVAYAKQTEAATSTLAAKAAASSEKNIAVDDVDYANASENAACALAYATSIQQSVAFVAVGVGQAIEQTKKAIKAEKKG